MTEQKNNGRPMTLLERVERLENAYDNIAKAVDSELSRRTAPLREAVQNVVEVLNATMKLQGEGFDKKVEELVLKTRLENDRANFTHSTEVLKQLIDSQVFVPVNVVTPNSVVVGYQTNLEGQPIGIGDLQLQVASLKDGEVKSGLIGKNVGEMYTGKDFKLEVREIYEQNPNPPKPEVTEAPEVTVTAAGAAPELVTAPETTPAPESSTKTE